jgi:hypothetical protein
MIKVRLPAQKTKYQPIADILTMRKDRIHPLKGGSREKTPPL